MFLINSGFQGESKLRKINKTLDFWIIFFLSVSICFLSKLTQLMKIGLLSDTHGYLDEKIYDYFSNCDEVWHAGDIGNKEIATDLQRFKPLRVVYGNIDGKEFRTVFPEDLFFQCEELQVWMTHIGGRPPRYTPRILNMFKGQAPDIFVCGHSHILKIARDDKLNMLYLNPGAAGKQGFHKFRTIVRFTVIEKKITAMEAIELGKR